MRLNPRLRQPAVSPSTDDQHAEQTARASGEAAGAAKRRPPRAAARLAPHRPCIRPGGTFHEGNGLSRATRAVAIKKRASSSKPSADQESTRPAYAYNVKHSEIGDARRDPGRAAYEHFVANGAARTSKGVRERLNPPARMIRRPDEASSRRPALPREAGAIR